jgi:hypothetical protein
MDCTTCYDEGVLALIGRQFLMAPCSVVVRRMGELQQLARVSRLELALDIGRRGGLPEGLKLSMVQQWVRDGVTQVPCDCRSYSVHQEPARDTLEYTP